MQFDSFYVTSLVSNKNILSIIILYLFEFFLLLILPSVSRMIDCFMNEAGCLTTMTHSLKGRNKWTKDWMSHNEPLVRCISGVSHDNTSLSLSPTLMSAR